MAIALIGTTIISFELDDDNNFKLRARTLILMTGSLSFWALGSVIFKCAALEENVAMRSNSKKILSLNVTNGALYMFANGTVAFAYLMALVAFVLLVQSLQPFFVLIIAIFLTIFIPSLVSERINAKLLIQKILALVSTVVGTYILLHLESWVDMHPFKTKSGGL